MKKLLDYAFIQRLQDLPFIDEIWLFGSRARGDYQERSDIDLALVCSDTSDADWMKVSAIIDDADTLLKIDWVKFDPNIISKELYANILQDKKVIYVKKQD